MGGVVNVQNPSACFSMSAFGPLQKLTRTLLASGALNRISTRELLSTRGYWAFRALDVAGLKSPEPCARQKGIAATATITISCIGPPGRRTECDIRSCLEFCSRRGATPVMKASPTLVACLPFYLNNYAHRSLHPLRVASRTVWP